ncbi:uncharacterized protein PITG_04265 [Phytophthora infestans T30-4]|uniref:Uncharacterized protein n=1 Tax=Phytophthora infestans (strain T30-4) TaxID=403677 RepID=D0N0V8_PHYIT|nr:uncharacterized protein PITG_04265 [Phytophthora infestans T30-4]EEY67271.1 hypothetical protein PITG_04265 [Phytophthora infestans T30-4]|eukprot:XP_002905919.1 hypothetical protein PITG_04265 [Phytophthora infestans T30-4]
MSESFWLRTAGPNPRIGIERNNFPATGRKLPTLLQAAYTLGQRAERTEERTEVALTHHVCQEDKQASAEALAILMVLLCGDKVPGNDFVFLVSDGYGARLGHIKRVFDTTLGFTWNEPVKVYVKRTNHAPQNITCWCHSRRATWKYHSLQFGTRRACGSTDMQLSCSYCSYTRIQEKLPRAAAFMSETGIEGGASTQRHAVVSQARLPDGSIEEVPHNTTFRQLQFINRQQNTMEQERAVQHARCDEAYRLNVPPTVCIHPIVYPNTLMCLIQAWILLMLITKMAL